MVYAVFARVLGCAILMVPAVVLAGSSSQDRVELSTSERAQHGHVYTGQSFRVPSERLKLLASPPGGVWWPVATDGGRIFVPNAGVLATYFDAQDAWTTEPLADQHSVITATTWVNQLYLLYDLYPAPQPNLAIFDLASHAPAGQLALPEPYDNDYAAIHGVGNALYYLRKPSVTVPQAPVKVFTYRNGSGWAPGVEAPGATEQFYSCADQTQVFVVGRPYQVGPTAQAKFFRFDSVAQSWSELPTPPGLGQLAIHGEEVYLASYGVLYAYNIAQAKWRVYDSNYPQMVSAWFQGGLVSLDQDKLQWYNLDFLELFVHKHK